MPARGPLGGASFSLSCDQVHHEEPLQEPQQLSSHSSTRADGTNPSQKEMLLLGCHLWLESARGNRAHCALIGRQYKILL